MNCDYGIFNIFVNNSNYLAMTGFFMLSGYSLVISNGNKDYRNKDNILSFYKKRFISIWPLYFVAGYLGVAMYIVMGKQTIIDNVILLPVELLCVQSFYDSLFSYSHNAGSWFISCLVACYFLFPLLNLLLKDMKKKNLIIMMLLFILLLAYFPYISFHFKTSSIYTNPFFRILEFTTGIIIAYINTNTNANEITLIKIMRNPLIMCISAIILILGIHYSCTHNIYMHWLPITFLPIILFGAGYITFSPIWHNKIFLYLSSISYAFFLGQKFVWFPTQYILRHTNWNIGNIPFVLIMLLACLLSASLLHEFVEKKAAEYLKKKILCHINSSNTD